MRYSIRCVSAVIQCIVLILPQQHYYYCTNSNNCAVFKVVEATTVTTTSAVAFGCSNIGSRCCRSCCIHEICQHRRATFAVTTTTTAAASKTCNEPMDDDDENASQQRRNVLKTILSAGIATGITTVPSFPSYAAETAGLAERLKQRNPNVLTNKLFNLPPKAQLFPNFMRGTTWDVSSTFGGYIFPSSTIAKETILANSDVPGFQKCSIAATADIGKGGSKDSISKEPVNYQFRIDKDGYEDIDYNLNSCITSYLQQQQKSSSSSIIQSVQYNRNANPNRISIQFTPYRTTNAERIELFVNARESEVTSSSQQQQAFVYGEYIRQVTFSGGSTAGVPRQVNTNYANFYTWIDTTTDASSTRTMKGNLLTVGYLDPQDALYFQEPINPIVVYSHILEATTSATT